MQFERWEVPLGLKYVTNFVKSILKCSGKVAASSDTFCRCNASEIFEINFLLICSSAVQQFDNDTRQILLDFVFETIHDGFYEELRHNSSFLNEENKFHNWYNGYTTIQFIKPTLRTLFMNIC